MGNRVFRIFLIYLLLFLPLLGICSDNYTIGPGDILNIKVAKEEKLSKDYPVNEAGNIAMEYLGEVKTAGCNTQEASKLIANKLKSQGYLMQPEVSVSVKEYHSQRIMVFGAMKKPGAYYLKGKTLVLDLLSQIDHIGSDGGKMTILRKLPPDEEKAINVDLYALLLHGDLSQNREILGGDKIIISRVISAGRQIYILGEVAKPGPYIIQRGLTVLEALRMAGGLTDYANKGKVKIIREENGKKKNIIVRLNKIQKGDTSEDITLEAGDVLVTIRSWF